MIDLVFTVDTKASDFISDSPLGYSLQLTYKFMKLLLGYNSI